MIRVLSTVPDALRFVTRDGQKEIDVRVDPETVWLTLDQIAELFERDKSGITRHLRNIYRSEELQESATVAKFATVRRDGGREVSRDIEYYNLDAILSVGYRVNDGLANILANIEQTWGASPSIRTWRLGRRTFSTLSSRTTRSSTATSASAACCSSTT